MKLDENEIPSQGEAEPARTEARGFAPGEMVTCDACLRANPPTRTTCLYCAAQLPVTAANAALRRPTLRKLEEGEQGFNVILLPGAAAPPSEETLGELAQLVRLEAEDLKRIFAAGVPLPLARTATREDATLVEDGLARAGLRAVVLDDSQLASDAAATKRARGFEFTESELVAHSGGGGGGWRVAWEEITLLVTGRLYGRRLEIEERRKRRSEAEIVSARETNTDELALDIYAAGSGDAVRVLSGSFDFSCLGARKGLLTGQNFRTLVELLRERSPSALTDDSYDRVRRALAAVWPVEQHTEPRGWRREGFGRVNTEAVTSGNSEAQFTRYSRLLDILGPRGGEVRG